MQITLWNKRKTVVSLASTRSRCRFNWSSLSSSSRPADFDHDDRLSSVALLSLIPYFFARYIFGGLEILPIALAIQVTTLTPFLLDDLSQLTCIGFEIYAQLRNTQFALSIRHPCILISKVRLNMHALWNCWSCWNCQVSTLPKL